MANITEEQALQAAKDAVSREVEKGLINDVTVEEMPNGWRVRLQADQPVIGMGQMFITTAGEAKMYPSSMSPRQAEEQFTAENPAQ